MSRAPVSRWAIAIAGMLSLAAAMGIGRFAFTPLLPMKKFSQSLMSSTSSCLEGVSTVLFASVCM